MPCTCGGDLGFLTYHQPDPGSVYPGGASTLGLPAFEEGFDDVELAGLVPFPAADDHDDELAGLVPFGDDDHDDELAGLVPFGDDDLDDELAGLVPFGEEAAEVGDLVSSAGAGLAAGAATGNPYVGLAVGLADAVGIDVSSLLNDFTSWIGFDACSGKNRKKYRSKILNATPETRRQWAQNKRIPGATGNCLKYARGYLARVIAKDEAKWQAESTKRQASAAEVELLRLQREQEQRRREEEERRRQDEFRRLREEKKAVEAERARREEEEAKRRRRMYWIGGGVAVAGVGTGAALYLRKRARARRGRAA